MESPANLEILNQPRTSLGIRGADQLRGRRKENDKYRGELVKQNLCSQDLDKEKTVSV